MCAVNQHSPLFNSLKFKAEPFRVQAAKALSNRSLLCISLLGLNDQLALISP